LNRSTSTFGSDAHIFKPSRWLETDPSNPSKLHFVGAKRSAGEFPVFNGGPRSCLGKKMAELMACWVMVRLLSEWEFEEVNDGLNMDVESGERRSANSLTLPMEGGLPVRVRRRERMGRDGEGRRKARRVEIEDEDEEEQG